MPLLENILYIDDSTLPNAGKGLFTRERIPKGARIVEYKGRVMTWAEAKSTPNSHNGYLFFINYKKCIDAWGYKKSFARYANDARGITRVKGIITNSKYVIENNRCYIEATKTIPPNSEIFTPYGSEYWKVIRENRRIDAQLLAAKGKTIKPKGKKK